MASSAKFLEEALSTDVDESAVSAIVGSLENQLVTSAPDISNQQVDASKSSENHIYSEVGNQSIPLLQNHVANGQSGTMNLILNSELTKGIASTGYQSQTTNTPIQGNCGNNFSQMPHTIDLIQPNNIGRTQEALKIVFPTSQTNANTVNINRTTYSVQPFGSLQNGNVNNILTTANVTKNVTNSNIQAVDTQNFTPAASNVSKVTAIATDQNKPTGTSLIIKSSNYNNPQLSSTMATTVALTTSQVNSNVVTTGNSGVVTITKPLIPTSSTAQTIIGNQSSTIMPANFQIVNVNPLRGTTPIQQGNKAIPSRFMLPQVINTRPGTSGITIQALQGLQTGQGGHLLLKTENGQYQLLRVGPATTPATNINTPNNSSPGFKLQPVTIPVTNVSTPNVSVTTTVVTTPVQTPSTAAQRGNDNTKEKCRKFLSNLLELSSREPKAVERNVRTLIQELVDTKVEPEEFCDRLEKLLNASPQPCLIGFLKKSLPLLRGAMLAREMVIEGIRPPSIVPSAGTTGQATVVLATSQSLSLQNSQPNRLVVGQQIRSHSVVNKPHSLTKIITPVRVQTPSGNSTLALTTKVVSSVTIPGAITTTVRIQSQAGGAMTTTSGQLNTSGPTINLVPATAFKPSTQVRHALIKTIPSKPAPRNITSISGKSSTPTRNSLISKTPFSRGVQIQSNQFKSSIKDKDRKGFAAAAGGYVAEDDVNDVAAMAGVNLAEETQRILGSTDFVGTQIRSCKDDTFLHAHPLLIKFIKTTSKHGLDEPSVDVLSVLSHAIQERLKTILEKLDIVAEHRVDMNKADPNYEVTHDVKGQLKCIEELDKLERRRHEETERELLLRAAKSRSKSEDPEQVKLKAKAREMQRVEMEELRQREANVTALQAIGPRKKIKLDSTDGSAPTQQFVAGTGTSSSGPSRTPTITSRPRLKRVTVRDLLFVLEQEKDPKRKTLLYKSYLR